MGWGNCGTDSKGRPIGYVHPARCDHPGCKTKIDRGLSYACGGMHGTGEGGCEGYFCEKHLFHVEDPFEWIGRQKGFAVVCEKCKNEHNALLVEELIEERNRRKTKASPADPKKATKLRTTCKRFGTTKLARLIGVHPSLLRKKAAGSVGITQRDETAIKQALLEIASESAG